MLDRSASLDPHEGEIKAATPPRRLPGFLCNNGQFHFSRSRESRTRGFATKHRVPAGLSSLPERFARARGDERREHVEMQERSRALIAITQAVFPRLRAHRGGSTTKSVSMRQDRADSRFYRRRGEYRRRFLHTEARITEIRLPHALA